MSAITPWTTGIIAPPATAILTAILRTPEAFPVSGPSSETAKVKMLGNMIELNSPTVSMVHIATRPEVSKS